MRALEKPHYLPDFDRLSIVAATLLLAFALARLINFPVSRLAFQLPGLFVSLQIDLRTLIAFLVAGQAAAGADWLVSDHPGLGKQLRIEHWLIPMLTAWTIGILIFQLPLGTIWWAGFALGVTILMLVLVAEYIVVDSEDALQPVASAGLTVVSFSLYLILAASLRYANLRLFLILPALTLAAWLICLRTLHLRLHGQWVLLPAGIVAVIIGQLVAAFHYLPLPAVSYALALTGAVYSLTSLMGSLIEGVELRKAWIEPVVVLVILWIIAFLIR